MKHLFFMPIILAFFPFSLHSQAATSHWNTAGEFDLNYPDNWVVHVEWKYVVNQVRKINKAGDVEIRYTNNYHSLWEFVNTVTGERKMSPEVENVTGVFSFGPGHYENDRHWVYHYVNDPVFGAYHINFHLLWQYDESTGFMEVMDVQNEWIKN